jgi:two-component system, chemotaxis family, protein-glutamate methylesterase/glutaminase
VAAIKLGAQQRVVAVGASAGGVKALIRLAAGLPRDLNYAVMVVLHTLAEPPSSRLARILDRSVPLPAVWAAHGDLIETGRIHVAVPNRHLLVSNGRVVLPDGPIEDGHRPAINPLFCSVALAYRKRAVGASTSPTSRAGSSKASKTESPSHNRVACGHQ